MHGQAVAVIRVRRGPDPDLIIRFPDGFYGAIAASWTDYVAQPDPGLLPDPPPLLDIFGLCRIVRLIDQLGNRQATDRDLRYVDDGHPSSN